MQSLASKYTVGTLDTNLTVENGESVSVYDINISNASGSNIEVDVQDVLGASIMKIPVSAGSQNREVSPFLADYGIQLALVPTVGGSVTATVFHSHGGA